LAGIYLAEDAGKRLDTVLDTIIAALAHRKRTPSEFFQANL
jgi:hypothetical protein